MPERAIDQEINELLAELLGAFWTKHAADVESDRAEVSISVDEARDVRAAV